MQFVASKALPGGREGVTQLASVLDIGLSLLLANVDLASLTEQRGPVAAETGERPAPGKEEVGEEQQQQQLQG